MFLVHVAVVYFFSPQRCWGSARWRTPWPRRWRCSPSRMPAWRWYPQCLWRPSHSAGPLPRRTNTPTTGRPGSLWSQSPGNKEEHISSRNGSYKSVVVCDPQILVWNVIIFAAWFKLQDQYLQKWVQSQSPCRRACNLNTPTEPPCCTGSRRWRCPQRTPPRRLNRPPSVWSRQSGYK